jgi:sulfate adenylyltransferase large subunit
MTNKIIKFLTAGSVDDGKSTLIGRLLYDTKSIYQDQIAEVKKLSEGKIDYSLFVEGLESERRQKITIDVAYRYFSHQGNKFIIADSPGHEQYTKNMAVAAANSEIAVILIDAKLGLKTQTIRHSYIAHSFGIRNFVVAINKMDLIGYDQEKFNQIRSEYLSKIKSLKLDDIYFIPISAINGDNIAHKSEKIEWYKGESLLDHLMAIDIRQKEEQGFRLVVQNVVKHENQRLYQGKIIAGKVAVGDKIYIYPSQKSAKVLEIIHSSKTVKNAVDGESVAIILDQEIDIDRGSVFSGADNKPNFSQNLKADLVWFGGEEFNLNSKNELLVKINHNLIPAKISAINHLVNIDDLSNYEYHYIEQNQIANVDISLAKSVAFDSFKDNKFSGSFLLIDKQSNETLAAGLIKEHKAEKIVDKENSFISEMALLIKKHFGEDGQALFLKNA